MTESGSQNQENEQKQEKEPDNRVGHGESSDRGRPSGRGHFLGLKIGASLGTLIVSAIGGTVGAALGPYLTHQQSKQDEIRAKRAEVYPAYLNAANDYFYSTDRLAIDLGKLGRESDATKSFDVPKSITREFGKFLSARNKYQEKVNSLYVYGSNAAWRAHKDMSRILPPSLGNYDGTSISIPREAEFSTAYRAFEEVECHELPAVSRSGC